MPIKLDDFAEITFDGACWVLTIARKPQKRGRKKTTEDGGSSCVLKTSYHASPVDAAKYYVNKMTFDEETSLPAYISKMESILASFDAQKGQVVSMYKGSADKVE